MYISGKSFEIGNGIKHNLAFLLINVKDITENELMIVEIDKQVAKK